jgi:hypothetical protein
VNKLKELEKQQEINKLEFEKKNQEVYRKSSLMEEKLETKSIFYY